MSDGAYGLDPAVRLVREFVDRPDGRRIMRSRRLPVLYFIGPHGIGKTTLLSTLESKLRARLPYARLDCAKEQDLTTQDVLIRLALDLNRECGMYGRLVFPRFATGLIAMDANVDAIPDVAPREMMTELARARHINQIRTILGDAAADLTSGIRIPGVRTLARILPGLAIGLLLRFPPTRTVLLGRGVAWYGRAGINPIDALVKLNRWARTPDADRVNIDQLLLAAFLADLRRAFGKGRRAARRPLNCVILLDNADAKPGAEFLTQLDQMRERTDADPVTVVATALPSLLDQPLNLDDTSLPPKGPIDPLLGGKRLTIRLRELTEPQVREMASADLPFPEMGPPGHVPLVVHQFTGGHPRSTDILIGKLREEADRPLSYVLGDALAGQLLDGLLEGFPRAYVRILTTCAAARDLHEMNGLQGLVDKADLKVIGDHWSLLHKSDDNTVMQPVLRHLLLRDLAARHEDAEDGWRQVFSRLREQADPDSHAWHYHALALRDFEPVATWLNHRLGDPKELPEREDAGPWLAALGTITAAPVENPPEESPHERVDTSWAGRWDSRPARVAHLVAGLQLAHEALTGLDRGRLHREIARSYLGLWDAAPTSHEVFGREAARHEELAKAWPPAKDAKR